MIQTEEKKFISEAIISKRERERKQSSEMGRSQYHATDEEVQSASPSCCFRPREMASREQRGWVEKYGF